MNEEHIGSRIEQKIRERGLTNTEFARESIDLKLC
jgi:hypothetical protein